MRKELLDHVKNEITQKLSAYLRDEGVALFIAANDNLPSERTEVVLEEIQDIACPSTKLITEIRVIMGVLGKPTHCDALIDGIYQCLHPHQLTLPELTVLLMSLHVESVQRVRIKRTCKKTCMRYIMEEETA